jgi:hypothetical protein
MAKETAFATPPRGHVAGLVYDAVNDQWIAQRATPWAYDGRWSEDLGETKSGDGTYSASSTAVPAGEVWVLEHAFCVNTTGARGLLIITAYTTALEHRLVHDPSPAQDEHFGWTGHLTLKEGDYIKILQASCLAGDIIYSGVWGHKMVVPS